MKIRLTRTCKFHRYTNGKHKPIETLTLKEGSIHEAALAIANGLCRRGFKRPCPERHYCPNGDRSLCLQIEHEMEMVRAERDRAEGPPSFTLWPVKTAGERAAEIERSKLEGEVFIDPYLDKRGHRPSEKWGRKLRLPSSWYQEVCAHCESEVYHGSCSECEWEAEEQ